MTGLADDDGFHSSVRVAMLPTPEVPNYLGMSLYTMLNCYHCSRNSLLLPTYTT